MMKEPLVPMIGIVTDVGLELAGEQNWQPCDEGRIAQLMRNRLKGFFQSIKPQKRAILC